MTSDQTHVIVGASLAGAKAAETLRDEGFDGRVVLVGTEEERPYERPPLSKDYLRGEVGREKVYVHDEGFYAEHDIELRLGRTAVSLDTANTRLELDDGEQLSYDRLLLTTGAEPRRLSVPGAELDGVFYLRSVGNSDALRERLDRGGAVVVVGAGWIGAEVAASARQRGLDVTVIEPASVPLERVLGKEIGAIYRDIHTDQGVRMLTGTGVEALAGDGAVERVRTSDGRVIDCDVVVVGVGVRPATAWLAGSDVALGSDGGVLTDARTRTSVPGVVAVGDCAAWESPRYGTRLRVEHWDTALRAPAIAAATLLGAEEVYDPVPYFWSEQFGRTVQTIGPPGLATRWVWREEGASWAACGLLGDRLVAVVAADRHHDAAAARRLLARGPAPGPPADPAVLADPSLPLRSAVA